jgi:methionine-rich copper-binding protein CopC
LLLFFTFFDAAGIPASAHAHAILTDSSPKDNSTLSTSPREVILRFSARIEKGISQITLLTDKGQKVPLPQAPHGYDAGPPDRLVIPLPQLMPGRYQLQYRILATDGHATPGLIRFTVSGRGTP